MYKHMNKDKVLPVKEALIKAMSIYHPPSKKSSGASYEEIANKWLNVMPLRLLSKSHFTKRCEPGELQLPVAEFRKHFMYRYGPTKQYWFDWMQSNFPLYMITKKGYQGNYSVGIPTFNLIDQLLKIDPQTYVETFDVEYNKTDELTQVGINLQNLQNFIDAKTRKLDTLTSTSSYLKLEKKIMKAIFIHKQATGFNEVMTDPLTGIDKHYIPQTHTVAYSGRRYYTGANAIQQQSKDLRAACLGACYESDLNVSVYSFYKLLATGSDIDTTVVTKLLSDKKRFRQSLADTITQSNMTNDFKLAKVKEALQAIGFGSDPENEFQAMSDIIYNKEDRAALNAHPDFKALATLYKQLLAKMKVEMKEDQLDYKKNTGKVKWTSYMSYLYQSYETIVMKQLMDYLEEQDRGILLWVHDGVYTHRRPNIVDMNLVVADVNKFATVELTAWEKWRAGSGLKSIIDKEEEAHRQRMFEQEKRAKIWAAEQPGYNPDAMEEKKFAMAMKAQGLY